MWVSGETLRLWWCCGSILNYSGSTGFHCIVEFVPFNIVCLCFGIKPALFSRVLDMFYHANDCWTIGCSLVFEGKGHIRCSFYLKVEHADVFLHSGDLYYPFLISQAQPQHALCCCLFFFKSSFLFALSLCATS